MQKFIGNTDIVLSIKGIEIKGALLNASLSTGEILVPTFPARDVYWKHIVIEHPLRLDTRGIELKPISVNDNSQKILRVKWKIRRHQIDEIAFQEKDVDLIYESMDISNEIGEIIIDSRTLIDEKVRDHLSRHPELIYDLSPRAFEELVASVLMSFGLDVELTPTTRDGGVDLIAYVKNRVASFLMVVECKKWRQDRPVGIDIVQRLYGVQLGMSANKSIIVTTSHFTTPAIDQCNQYKGLMELKDFEQLKGWLSDSPAKSNQQETKPNKATAADAKSCAAE